MGNETRESKYKLGTRIVADIGRRELNVIIYRGPEKPSVCSISGGTRRKKSKKSKKSRKSRKSKKSKKSRKSRK